MKLRPMLAAPVTDEQLEDLPYPLLLSPKYDGIRALEPVGGPLKSRKLIDIPNREVQRLFDQLKLRHCDGELIAGDPTAPDCYNRTQDVVMERDAPADDVWFYVFDSFRQPEAPYVVRRLDLPLRHPRVKLVPQHKVRNAAEVRKWEVYFVKAGYEGIMLRAYTGPYKCGRSTLKQAWLLKLKRYQDSEAVVLRVYERQRNTNKATRNALGYAKRSSAKAGKVGTGLLGGFQCRDLKSGVVFDCGTGKLKRHELVLHGWEQTIIKYRFQPAGVKEKPRYPRYIGKRDRRDM